MSEGWKDDLTVEPTSYRTVGGQHVGMTTCGVKVTHFPTKMSATCEAHRSQHMNRKVATDMIEWGLIETGYLK